MSIGVHPDSLVLTDWIEPVRRSDAPGSTSAVPFLAPVRPLFGPRCEWNEMDGIHIRESTKSKKPTPESEKTIFPSRSFQIHDSSGQKWNPMELILRIHVDTCERLMTWRSEALRKAASSASAAGSASVACGVVTVQDTSSTRRTGPRFGRQSPLETLMLFWLRFPSPPMSSTV